MTETETQTVRWLAESGSGESAKTMAFWLAFGLEYQEWKYYPEDLADFKRCLWLLALCQGYAPYFLR